MNRRRKTSVFVVFSLIIFNSSAYEVDNFTDRYNPLPDANGALSTEVNRRLSEAITKKIFSRKCDQNELTRAVRGQLGGWVVGSMESYADKSETVKRHSSRSDTIYSQRDTGSKVSGFMMTLAGLNSSINLNGQYVGADKLGHFFDQGYEYYEIYSRSGPQEGVKKALIFGDDLENGIFGSRTTGVKSYGDLAANFEGLKFWLSLSGPGNPYFKCQQGKWVQVRPFDFADYVSPAWDEAINCSNFRSNELAIAVQEKAKTLEEKAARSGRKQRFQCPVSPNECVKLSAFYGDNAKLILGPGCRDAKPELDAPRKSSGQESSVALGEDKKIQNDVMVGSEGKTSKGRNKPRYQRRSGVQ